MVKTVGALLLTETEKQGVHTHTVDTEESMGNEVGAYCHSLVKKETIVRNCHNIIHQKTNKQKTGASRILNKWIR